MTETPEIPERTRARIAALRIWRGDLRIAPLLGGISNESWRVTDDAGDHVVRFGQDFPFHHVIREREVMTARAAESAGFAPAVEHAGPGVMVSRFLGARTYGEADVRGNLARVADLVRRFHRVMPRHVSGPAFLFWPFHVVRDYARTLQKGESRMVPRLPGWLDLADELEAAQMPLPIVFGHNDLLPANLLDDGERLWLIDFEYAGYSTAMFDLAGLSSNAGFTSEQSDELLALYFDRAPDRELRRALSAMQCASLLREAMWSMVSELHLSAPGTDYPAYTQQNLDRLGRALEDYRTEHG